MNSPLHRVNQQNNLLPTLQTLKGSAFKGYSGLGENSAVVEWIGQEPDISIPVIKCPAFWFSAFDFSGLRDSPATFELISLDPNVSIPDIEFSGFGILSF